MALSDLVFSLILQHFLVFHICEFALDGLFSYHTRILRRIPRVMHAKENVATDPLPPATKKCRNYNKKWLKTLDSRGTNIVYYIGKFARDLFGQGKLQASRMGL